MPFLLPTGLVKKFSRSYVNPASFASTGKMKSLLFILVCLIPQLVTVAQGVDKKAIDEWVKLIDTTASLEEKKIYVINGIVVTAQDDHSIDSVIQSYNPRHLVDVNFIACRQMNLPHCINNVVVIRFAYQQKKKIKQSLLKKIRQRFTDNYTFFSHHIFTNAKDPVLYVDNKVIHHSEAKQTIHKLKQAALYYIDFTDQPASVLHYGQNAKNGLVRIWTKPTP